MNIRTGKISDIEAVMALEAECMPHPWSRDDIAALFDSENKIALIAEEDGCTAGYVGASMVIDEAEIGNICVSPKFRRRGIAKALLNELIRVLKERGVCVLFLEVESTNTGAIALYEQNAFEKYSERKDYYGAGKDALLYKNTKGFTR